MSKTQKVLFAGFAAYIGIFIALIVIYGFTQHKNNTFQIQNEFKLVNWVSLGVFSINRAVLYLFIATLLTIFTMVWIARRMQARPNKIQTAVEVLYSLMRNNITRGNMPDSMAARWFPFIGTLFLFIWFCNLVG
jgi:F-type H+-transporting ATPase subunit a